MNKINENELVVHVRKGVNVRVVEVDDSNDLEGRDIKVQADNNLKIEVNRIDAKDLGSVASKVALCG